MKKIYSSEHVKNVIELYNLCYERDSCTTCPMRVFQKNSRTVKCMIPLMSENPSYVVTALKVISSQSRNDLAEKKYRETVFFDNYK